MNSYVNPTEKKADATAEKSLQKKSERGQEIQHADNRPEAAAHAVLQNNIDNSEHVKQFAKIGDVSQIGKVAQLNGKKGEDDGGKKKGDDYCNNIGKLVRSMGPLLPGLLNSAITDQLTIIDTNRSKCSVSSDLVVGPDTNTSAYGSFAESVTEIMNALGILVKDSDLGYILENMRRHVGSLDALLQSLPDICVDSRVAKVIGDGVEGDKSAMSAINKALAALAVALRARFALMLEKMEARVPKKKDDDDNPEGGTGAGAPVGGGGALVEAH